MSDQQEKETQEEPNEPQWQPSASACSDCGELVEDQDWEEHDAKCSWRYPDDPRE